MIVLVVAGGLIVLFAGYGLAHDLRRWLHGHQAEPYGPPLVVYQRPDGEILEFPTSWEWPADEVASLIGDLEGLPEVTTPGRAR